jgi:hypothetical protein
MRCVDVLESATLAFVVELVVKCLLDVGIHGCLGLSPREHDVTTSRLSRSESEVKPPAVTRRSKWEKY